jgi:protein-L-isoaspartate(D-aspartate) O-methyltransferase
MKPMTEAHLAILRRHMVEVIALQADLMSEEIGKDILGERVLEPMRRVRRRLFVPPELAAMAYHDTPLPIGFDKTVSQPFICALMTDLLDPQPHEAVLEVGTGLGYQAAVLAELARDDAVLSAQYCLDRSIVLRATGTHQTESPGSGRG